MKPYLLDLFCGAGGASKGYADAGFEVVGVDIDPQPHYPYHFIQDDALEFVAAVMEAKETLGGDGYYDAIHASPPCPRYSSATAVSGDRDSHPDLVAPTRDLLKRTGLPYVIENVPRAPLENPVTLCGAELCPTIEEDGETFYMRRHRLFEANFPIMVPPCSCHPKKGTTLGIYGGGARQVARSDRAGGDTRKATAAQAARLMGIDWMTRDEMTRAIPPSYTAHIGEYLMREVEARRAVAV